MLLLHKFRKVQIWEKYHRGTLNRYITAAYTNRKHNFIKNSKECLKQMNILMAG